MKKNRRMNSLAAVALVGAGWLSHTRQVHA